MKAGVQRSAGDAVVARPAPLGVRVAGLRVDEGCGVRGQGRLEERIQTTGGLLEVAHENGVPDRVRRAIADQSRRLSQRVPRRLDDRRSLGALLCETRVDTERVVAETQAEVGHPLHAPYELGKRDRAGGGPGRRIRSGRELAAQARHCVADISP
jgi:hypothetical protein